MAAGSFARPDAEVDTMLDGARAGDPAAMATNAAWCAEVRASISEGFCPSCDAPLSPGRTCPGYGPGPGNGHGLLLWSRDGCAGQLWQPEPERPRGRIAPVPEGWRY